MNGHTASEAVTITQSNNKLEHLKGLSMVVVAAVLWGVSGTAAQVLFDDYGYRPGWLVSVRMIVSGLLLLLISLIGNGGKQVLQIWTDKRDALRLLIYGIVALMGVQYTYFAAIRYGNAATATLLQYLGPVFITVYLILKCRRVPNIWESSAVLLAMIGTCLLITNGNLHTLTITPAALIWGLSSAFALAFYTLYPGQMLKTYGAATVIGWAMLIGGVGMSVLAPPWDFIGNSTWQAWGLVGFVVVFGTLIAFYLYLSSMKYITPTETSVVACTEPLSAVVVSVVFLNVRLGLAALLGGLCVIATVVMLAWKGPSK